MVFGVCGATLLMAGQVNAATVTDHVVINEIMANPSTGEVEWIELYNPTDTAINMSGWRLVVTSGNFSGVFASEATINPHSYIVRQASDTTSKLNNTSATITLKSSASSGAIDEVSYAGIVQAKTYARTCDASDIWVAQAEPTRGAANCSSTVSPPMPIDSTPPVINEIVGGEIRQAFSLVVAARDETSNPSIVAILSQYGTEVARCEGIGSCLLQLDTVTLPNGLATLEITAKDAVGNSTTKTVAYTVANTPATIPSVKDPVSQPEISAPTQSPLDIAPISTATTPFKADAVAIQAVVKVSPTVASTPVLLTDSTNTALAVSPIKTTLPTNTDTGSSDRTVGITTPIGTKEKPDSIGQALPPGIVWRWIVGGLAVIVIAITVWRWRRRHKT